MKFCVELMNDHNKLKGDISLKKKKIFVIILICIIAVIGIYIYSKFAVKRETSLLSDTIEEKVEKLAELSAIKYNYTNVVTFKDAKQFKGIDIPFTSKGFLIKYSGYIKGGVELNNPQIDVKDNLRVSIVLDKPKVLENVIDEESVYIYDERDSVFNKLSFNDLYDALIKEKQKTEKEIIDKGFLKEAENNTKEIISDFLTSLGFKEIKIEFR
ncbi:DUF4230 domain-containing protein [Acidilutibacter cellobiosedens]|jgi:hypothetical protein|uniref:DUF4230 domain-containing protein n=1 Tax=Acidilutibacter cellobiosedens TaxID=2507161 RepID=A0A410QFD2_9FIRM|nr:DUF4230 domain-containing protein [Tissierellaceae bacterium]QAT62614.1 DUF4230 domain-containing protein [Acidilutibacter cellobiosedens]